MNKSNHKGGRLAANFRRANIAEGLAVQMLRPFAAIAQVPREEDHGIDLIATLLRGEGRSLVAEDSFVVQVKTHTASNFEFEGEGINWLRQLRLPYFPVVANLEEATATLYTLNQYHMPIHAAVLSKIHFCVDGDGLDDFPLNEPLMRWSIGECAHPQFPDWAYSILKPAIRIETNNQLYGPMWHFVELLGGPYEFKDRNSDGTAIDPPHAGSTLEVAPGDDNVILESLQHVLGPFANWVSNTVFNDDRSADLLQLRASFRRLGLDPDPTNRWDNIAKEMASEAEKQNTKG